MAENLVEEVTQARTIRVLVTSLDGNLTHPFRADQTVGEVHRFSYDHLVRQKQQIPFERTWLEYNDQRQEDATVLSTLLGRGRSGSGSAKGDQPDPDLTLALVWDTGGGRS